VDWLAFPQAFPAGVVFEAVRRFGSGLLLITGDGKGGVIKGEARDEKELFEFCIEPFVSGGFKLSIRYSGDCHQNVTGAGVWPSVEKAK
jgi:hypothetical protein